MIAYRNAFVALITSLITVGITKVDGQTLVTPLENYISTAFNFLAVTPNAEISGMGDAGTAVMNMGNLFTNAAANTFMVDPTGLALDYKRAGNNLLCLSGYGKGEKFTSAFGLRYNSLGGMTLITPTGNIMQTTSNYEFAVDGSIAMPLSDKFSAAATAKMIYSNISTGTIINGVEIQPTFGAAFDLSCFYRDPISASAFLNIGAALSNISGKVEYGYPGYTSYVPVTLSVGMSYESKTAQNNTVIIALDLNKLVVPTINDPNVTAFSGMIHSFNDAPGGFSEELHEITIGTGLSFIYQDKVSLRSGYFYEHPTKGGRTYLSLGGGIAIGRGNLDVAYRFYDNSQALVVDNALALTLSVNL